MLRNELVSELRSAGYKHGRTTKRHETFRKRTGGGYTVVVPFGPLTSGVMRSIVFAAFGAESEMAKKLTGSLNTSVLLVEEDAVDFRVTITKTVAVPKEQILKGEVTVDGKKQSADPALLLIEAVKFNLDSAINTIGYREAQEQIAFLSGDITKSIAKRIEDAQRRTSNDPTNEPRE